MPQTLSKPAATSAARPVDGELYRPIELLAKLFEGPEGHGSGLEDLLARLEWKETTR